MSGAPQPLLPSGVRGLLAIELNDAGIVLATSEGLLAEPSPGYAIVDSRDLHTGAKAARRARLMPRRCHDRFWQELSTESLGRPFPHDFSTADLAHAHLLEVWEDHGDGAEAVLLAVPGSHSEAQLGLILGIARASEIPVLGLVDLALAAAATVDPSRRGSTGADRLLHLDFHLHRAILTEIRRDRGEVVRRGVEILPDIGLAELYDAWMRRISQLFVHTTRFDPLHFAETEQALFDHLPAHLAELERRDKSELVMEAGGVEYALELTTESLIVPVAAAYEHLVGQVASLGGELTLLLSGTAAALPGLRARFEALDGVEVVELPVGAAADGALLARRGFEVGEPEDGLPPAVPFVSRLPLGHAGSEAGTAEPEPSAEPEEPEASILGRRPTHVLHEAVAYAITEEPLVVGVQPPEGRRSLVLEGQTSGISRAHLSLFQQNARTLVEDHSTYGSFLNGERIGGRAVLAAGDRLRTGSPGIELQLIAVEGAEDVEEGDGEAA